MDGVYQTFCAAIFPFGAEIVLFTPSFWYYMGPLDEILTKGGFMFYFNECL